MYDYQRWILAAAGAVSVLAAQGVEAQYYLGAETGREHLSFKPEYRFVNGDPAASYHNEGAGSTTGMVGGYHWKSARDFSLDVQGRLSVSNADWEMSLAEPASFRYDLPVNVAVSLLPSFRLTEHFAVFAEGGLALGKIRERKSAVTTSQYDVEKWRPGIVAGVGVSLALDERWSLRAGYRRTWYQNHEFDTYLADGTRVETVTSRVVQSTTTIGLIREF
ncbi:outer membrane beta-barrel protein [Rhodocyclus purpureus]|uniref:outer membrane beta-barrel protein n=1 Tax=Rhodocyclus purpureus TaxID=1067 RepID=UPI0019125D29|nr:outer membrane beta-barrel protein [Rhodocyclus purpureus]